MSEGVGPADGDILSGGGEMGARIRAFDWASTPLGPAATWPPQLRHALALCLASPLPTVIWWGRATLTQFYNDACIPLLGPAGHPPSLGRSAPDCWSDSWAVTGPLLDTVFTTGVSAVAEDVLVAVNRALPHEEVYVTFPCAAIRGDANTVDGIFCSLIDTTARVVAARRLDALRRLDEQTTEAATVSEVCAKAEAVLAENRHDIPFAGIYRPDASGRFSAGIAAPEALASVAQSRRPALVSGLALAGGAWPEAARQALLLPLSRSTHEPALGVLALGVSPRRPLDADYRMYFDLIATRVAAAMVDAGARERECRRGSVVVENSSAGKRSEEALRESEATLRAVIEEAPLAIALTGRSGEIVLRNPRFDQLWGRPAHVTTASTYSEVYEGYHLDGRRIESEEWPGARAVLKGETIENEVYELVQASGRRIACWFGAMPLRSTSGEIVGAVVVFRDVTEERRTSDALRQANAALAEADRRKDEFIAVLSHELRNPLAPIRYALPLLGEEPLGERGSRAIAVIERQVAHVVRLVDDLLDVSRIATGKIELRRDLFTLGSIVSTAVEAASPAIAAARHSLEIAVPDQPIWLYVDPARISQAITNLLNNSARYTPPGGRIRLEASASDDHVTIRVVDNGIGLDRQALATVFGMFRQAHDRNGSQGGLGIGLTLARQLVELHGGSIDGHSEGAGRGAEFVIRLPLAVAAAPGTAPGPPSTGHGQPARIRVLVIDDNVDLVEMLAMVVEGAGHHVRKAFDGASGVSAALEYEPDLILLDVGMPGMNGTDVVRELRRHPALAGTRFVALTGWGQAEDRQRTAAAGFDDHLTKPAAPEQIQRILQEVAARARD